VLRIGDVVDVLLRLVEAAELDILDDPDDLDISGLGSFLTK